MRQLADKEKKCGTTSGVTSGEVDVGSHRDLSDPNIRRAAFALDRVLVEMGELSANELSKYEDLVAP